MYVRNGAVMGNSIQSDQDQKNIVLYMCIINRGLHDSLGIKYIVTNYDFEF